MRGRRSAVRRLLVDSLPLLLSYVATVGGASWIVRHASVQEQAAYLVVSVSCPQIGLWSDWGRVTALLVRTQGNGEDYLRKFGPLVRRLPLVSVPTIALGTVLLVALPLSEQLDGRTWLEVSLASAAAALLINTGNALRGALLATDRRTAFFWSQLWVAAGIPALVAVLGSVSLGVLLSGVLYVLQQLVLLRGRWRLPPRRHHRLLETRAAFLRGDGLSWGIGATQFITAASVAVELPLLVALAPETVLPYYAVTRLVQGLVSIANRPVERGLPDVVKAAGSDGAAAERAASEWASAVRHALAVAVAGAIVLLPTAGPLSTLWLGRAASPSWLLLAVVTPGAVVTVLYRAAASEAVAEQDGRRLLRMAVLDLLLKVALGALLVRYAGDEGLAVAALLSTVVALLASRRLRLARTATRVSVPV